MTALGLTSDGSAPLTLLRRARFMDLVVLLDNCEHVLDAVCEVLDAVLGNRTDGDAAGCHQPRATQNAG